MTVPKGYTTASAVETYLNRALTSDQETYALTTVLAAVESYIDRETRRAWYPSGLTVTNEDHPLIHSSIYTRYRPVLSVQALSWRTTAVGDTPQLLTANVDYELFDATLGQINFVVGYHGRNAVALVSYTPNLPVPADISHAATMIVAHSMTQALSPGRLGMVEQQIDGLRLQYQDGLALHVPIFAQRIIDGYDLPTYA